jgi:hypothetical protein
VLAVGRLNLASLQLGTEFRMNLVPTYDSVFFNPTGLKDDIAQSRIHTINYIVNYLKRNRSNYLFDITADITSHESCAQTQVLSKGPSVFAANCAGVKLVAIKTLYDSIEIVAEFRYYHRSSNARYTITQSSILKAGKVLRDYYEVYPRNHVVVLDSLRTTMPSISFNLVPEDTHSGHIELTVCADYSNDTCQNNFTTKFVVDLCQLKRFGEELTKMLSCENGVVASLYDTITFGTQHSIQF